MAHNNESPEGDWVLVMPEENKESSSRASNFFADAIADPGHELGPYIKPSTHWDSPSYNHSNIVTMAPANEDQIPGKTCLVTVGATASFRRLIEEVVSPKVVAALAEQGYDSMVVQCGPDFEHFEAIRPSDPAVIMSGFSIERNITDYIRECTPSDGPRKRHMGLVITHAGAGSLMDALRINTRVIAVPNADLMGNHQIELAEEFENLGWLIHSQLGKLHEAIKQSADFIPSGAYGAYPPKPPSGSENRGLEQITQDVVNGTWHGSSGSTLSEYLRGPLRYVWDVLSAHEVGPGYDNEPREGPAGDSDQESDEDAGSGAEIADSPKPKLKRVLFDNGDGTSTATYVPVPENESPGFFGRLFGRNNGDDAGARTNQADAGAQTDAGAHQADSEAHQDNGPVDEYEQRRQDVFDSLFGNLDNDDGYQETDPEVLRRTRAWEEVDDRFDSLYRLYIG
ncbi:glycosyltransferase family 1 protein [Apiospora aurea]|uniref:UDP-N-acetylglucosamine transferase subunit ALG13 n=1 Tax=Apiospora aurea TaxID=335848 RepID=A0ABR1QCF8_9PEZI